MKTEPTIGMLAYRLCGPAFLAGIIVISLLVGCGHGRLDPRLLAADSLMDEHPDSALMILEDFRFTPKSSNADSAYYALLLTHARYKNFIDETDDSLISIASDHFLSYHDSGKASRSLFLKGMIQMNANHLGDAAVSFRQGLDIAHDTEHYIWEGQCARGLFILYSHLYDGSSQLQYAKKAWEAFENANDEEWEEYAKLNLARAYNNNGLYREADSVVSEIIAVHTPDKKCDVLDEAYQLKGLSLFAIGNFEDALQNYRKAYELSPSILTTNDILNIKVALSEVSQQTGIVRIQFPMDSVAREETNADEFTILADNGQYKEAYESLERYKNEQDSVLSIIIKNNVAESLNQYDEMQKALDYEKEKFDRMYYWILILLVLVVACSFICIYRERMHKEHSLRLKTEADIESLRADFKIQMDNANQKSERIKESAMSVTTEDFLRIIRQQYADTNKMCDDFYQGVKSERERLTLQIDMIVADLTEGEGIEKIKRYVDEQSGGLYSSFTKDFFNLTDDDKRLFLYQMLGFSSRTIALIIGHEPKTVYNRRARLKAKIEHSNVPKKDAYMKAIQKTKNN